MPVWALLTTFLLVVAGAAIGFRYSTEGSFDTLHVILTIFLAVNVLVCLWQWCLFLRRDYIGTRVDHWRTQGEVMGASASKAFMNTRLSISQIFSVTFWSEIYSVYSVTDPAYTDKTSCGFNTDIWNGFWTFIPTVLLLVTFASPFIPPFVTGVIGIALFHQWIFGTVMYSASFYVGGHYKSVSTSDAFLFIWVINGSWILCAVLGFYVSVRLILNQNYGVLGF